MLSVLPPPGPRVQRELAAAVRAELTYPERGATAGPLPPGYRHLRRETLLGEGGRVFERAGAALTTWGMHRGAGLRLDATSSTATVGVTLVQAVRVGPVWATAPCQVVTQVQEPRRVGFAYGTLPGHPESGEELFVVSHRDDDRVVLSIVAFSRPGTLLVAALGPLAALLQSRTVDRYLAALRRLSADVVRNQP